MPVDPNASIFRADRGHAVRTGIATAAPVLLFLSFVTGCGGASNGSDDNSAGVAVQTTSPAREAGPAIAPGGAGLAVVPMTGCVGAEYYAATNIGDDPVNLILDSGSTTIAVASSKCPNCNTTGVYDADTGTPLSIPADGLYVDGSQWSGVLYEDNVDLGPLEAPLTPEVPVKFAVVTAQKNFFFTAPTCVQGGKVANDGILGLGPDALLAEGSSSFLTALTSSGQMAHDTFAVQTCEVGGKLMLGGYDTSTVAEQPFFVPLSSATDYRAYYSIPLAGMQLGGTSLGLSAHKLGSAVLDMGATSSWVPQTIYRPFLAQLTASKAFTANFDPDSFQAGDCVTAASGADRATLDASLPKWQLVLTQSSGAKVPLELDATRSYLAPVTGASGNVYYCPTVTEVEDTEMFILGNPVMPQHVIIVDRKNGRVGFAQQNGCPSTLTFVEEST